MARSTTTMWGGLTIGKRALQNWKKGGSDENLIKNIIKYNKSVLEARRVGNELLGTEDPFKTLKKAISDIRADYPNRKIREGFKRKESMREAIKNDLADTIRSGAYTAKSERIPKSFKDLVKKTMSAEERKDLRKFLGWKKGYSIDDKEWSWNNTEKRFEKKVIDDAGVEHTYFFNYRTVGKNIKGERYANKVIEYGEVR